jgi:dihydroorotase
MSVGPTFDLLLQGGRVIDPGSGTDGPRDVAIRNGKIVVVQSGVLPSSAREVVDVTGKIVLRGLIDTHAHVYQYVTGRFGINPDMVGVQSGVTTLVDQGGPSCMTLPGFRHFIAEQSHSRGLAFLSAYLVGGLEGHYYPNLYRPDCVDIEATVKVAVANRDLVRGIKAHSEIGGFARWGIGVIEMAAEIGRRADLPVTCISASSGGCRKAALRPLQRDRAALQVRALTNCDRQSEMHVRGFGAPFAFNQSSFVSGNGTFS